MRLSSGNERGGGVARRRYQEAKVTANPKVDLAIYLLPRLKHSQ